MDVARSFRRLFYSAEVAGPKRRRYFGQPSWVFMIGAGIGEIAVVIAVVRLWVPGNLGHSIITGAVVGGFGLVIGGLRERRRMHTEEDYKKAGQIW